MSREELYSILKEKCIPLLNKRLIERLDKYDDDSFNIIHCSEWTYKGVLVSFYYNTISDSNILLCDREKEAHECRLRYRDDNYNVVKEYFHGYTDEELKIKEIIE